MNTIGEALGRVPSGLFIVTIRAGDRANAFLASWVQQAAFEPPALSVAIKKGRPALELLSLGGIFGLHVLKEGDKKLLKHFSAGFPLDGHPYQGLETRRGSTGVEILPDALAWMECRVMTITEVGDNMVVFGEILNGAVAPEGGEPAIWTRKSGFTY